MIKIESIVIHEFRGIRELNVPLDRETFVVHGPNGSGKSGIVDAIQFALTGEISRLRGTGTSDLTLAEHGPHILARTSLDTAWVKLTVFIPALNITATIERSLKKPTQPKILPKTPEVTSVFNSISLHPEISLSRREIIKFILSADGQRSTDVQTLLQLSDIGVTRAALQTAQNKIVRSRDMAKSALGDARTSLSTHLGIAALAASELLKEVNARRVILSLNTLSTFDASTRLTEGLEAQDQQAKPQQSRESALRDFDALAEAVTNISDETGSKALESIVAGLERLKHEPALERSIKRLELLETGVELVDTDECPLCETIWDAAELRARLKRRLQESRSAAEVRTAIELAASTIAAMARRVARLVEPIEKLPEVAGEVLESVATWRNDLATFATSLETIDGIKSHHERLSRSWTAVPDNVFRAFPRIRSAILERPAQTQLGEARDFLTVAQERLNKWQAAAKDFARRKADAERAEVGYATYVAVADATLASLYQTVESEFAAYYRVINEDDEGSFSAKLTPSESTLRLDVDFFGHGLCPPGAYHSEGHQDGMGLCLFLALVKQSLGNDLTLVVLDDVVMSVDSGHRRNICRLLKASFPNTQFVITTHDQVWARQMRSGGLVSAKNSLAFHSWNVETGPIVNEVTEVWIRIEKDLQINDVPSAAAKLRRHLEFVCSELADLLAAPIAFKGDNAYDLGDLLPSVVARQKSLLGSAAKAANSWNRKEELARIAEFRSAHSAAQTRQSDEAWMVNKSVHFVEWANLTPAEFEPLANAYQQFLAIWRCGRCDTWLSLSSRHNPKDLRCSCTAVRFNLEAK